jgi:Ni/Fe-hydrogenase 1 B-type cytochrome subunit
MTPSVQERPPERTFRPGFGAMTAPDPVRRGEYRWVYLWGWPVRAMHWLAAASIILLVITGFVIGPPHFLPSADISSEFMFGWMRFLHFAAAAVLVATGLVRVYWLFAGNKFERLPALFPLRPRDLKNLLRTVRFYLMIRPETAPHYLGHNPMQQLAYTGVYLVTIIMVVTGFIMYGQSDPNGLIFKLFYPLAPLFGGIQMVRLIHHVLTWFFPAFLVLHVYLALRADIYEREASISSIVSGGRFVPSHHEYEDE